MNIVEIDGKRYDVLVTAIERTAEVRQSENAGITLGEGAEETLDTLGTFISYAITFCRRVGHEREFDELWECVVQPYNTGVWVNVVYNQTTLRYKAKFSVTTQGLQKIDKKTGKKYWGEMTVTCAPVKAQVVPRE